MNLKIIVAIILLILLLITGFTISKMTGHAIFKSNEKVKIETNYGDIVVEIYSKKAPATVENFRQYIEDGFYDNTLFHRVIDGFMIQGGGFDAETGEQRQTNPPIKLESDNGLKNERGTIAMARTSIPDSATSQFFINTADNEFLNYGYRDEGYAVFGKVLEGIDVIDEISKLETDSSDKPLEDIIILKVSFVE